MSLKNVSKILGIVFLFIIVQAYFSSTDNFLLIISKWEGYFTSIILAVFIAILLNPIVNFFKKKLKINLTCSISLSMVFVVAVFLLLLLIIIPQIISSMKELNQIFPYITNKADELFTKFIYFLEDKNIYRVDINKVDNYFSNFIRNNSTHIQKILTSLIGNIFRWSMGITNLGIAFVLAFLILLDREKLINTLTNVIKIIFGVKSTDYVLNKLRESKKIFLNYIAGKLIVSFIVGLCVYIILLITKTPYAALSAILLGLGNMIPYVGSLVGGVIAFFLILIIAPIKTIFLLVAIIVSQLVDGFIVGPKIIGDKVGLSSFWVMVSMIIFGNLFGLMGMFLGTPILSIIKLFYNDLVKKAEREVEK